jgi:hypothetical protein
MVYFICVVYKNTTGCIWINLFLCLFDSNENYNSSAVRNEFFSVTTFCDSLLSVSRVFTCRQADRQTHISSDSNRHCADMWIHRYVSFIIIIIIIIMGYINSILAVSASWLNLYLCRVTHHNCILLNFVCKEQLYSKFMTTYNYQFRFGLFKYV